MSGGEGVGSNGRNSAAAAAPAHRGLQLGPEGWVHGDGVRRLPSPHHDARPAGTTIDLLVLHNITLPPGGFGGDHIAAFFRGTLDLAAHPFFATLAGARVSAHFVIERSGRITQFVSCHDRAWHAGASVHRGRARCNDFSVGVELEGTDFTPFCDAQYAALAALTAALRAGLPITLACGHSDIAQDRKTDPGPLFDWTQFTAQTGLARG
jgi:AmpD protein